MQYARDRFDLDPHWHYCPGCDSAGDFKPDERGLCPECASRTPGRDARRRQLPSPPRSLPPSRLFRWAACGQLPCIQQGRRQRMR